MNNEDSKGNKSDHMSVFQKNTYSDIGTNIQSYNHNVTTYKGDQHLPSVDVNPHTLPMPKGTGQTPTPLPEKRSRGKRLVKAVAGSLYNTIDDHTARHIRSLKPYHDHFILSTWNGFVSVYNDTSYYEAWLQVNWIDEQQLPFRAIVTLVKKDNDFDIEESFSLLLATLAIATTLMFYSLYHTVYAVTVFVSSMSFIDAIGAIYWVTFFLFTVLIYLFYSFHCWVLKNDRFGTFSLFLKDYKQLEMNAIFPYRLNWKSVKGVLNI